MKKLRAVTHLHAFRKIILILLALSCSPQPAASKLQGFVSREDDRWQQTSLSVCFEQAQGYERDRSTIRDAVEPAFAAVGIQFFGWELCTLEQSGIRIRFDEQALTSNTFAIGRGNDGVIAGMTIGMQSSCPLPYTGSHCEVNFALHEFGHALGLRHEMNRPDDVGCKYQQKALNEQAVQIGDYDHLSIMNYCQLYQANEQNIKLSLSEGDKATLRELYFGMPSSFAEIPPLLIESRFETHVIGPQLASYRLARGIKGQVDCTNEAIYGSPLDQSLPLLIEVSTEASSELQSVCILGESREGRKQSADRYTSFDFYVIPGASLKSGPELVQEPRLSLADSQTPTLDVQLTHDLPLQEIYAALSYKDSYTSLSARLIRPKRSTDGRYTLAFDRSDFPFNGEVYLSSVIAIDILGRTKSLDAFSATGFYDQSSWAIQSLPIAFSQPEISSIPEPIAPKPETSSAQPFEADAPTLSAWLKLPQNIALTTDRWIDLDIQDASSIVKTSLKLRQLSDSASPASIFGIDQGEVAGRRRILLNVQDFHPNGLYRIEEVTIEDRWGNRRILRANQQDTLFPDTHLLVPQLLLNR